MLIHDLNRNFNTIFHFYFDRNDDFNCYVSFNFVEFLKDNSDFPEIYKDEFFLQCMKNSLKFDFYLQDINGKEIKFNNVKNIDLFDNKNIITFLLKMKEKGVINNNLIRCNVTFMDGLYDYINVALTSKCGDHQFGRLDYQNEILLIDIKNILDKKYINQFSQSTHLRTYEFFSDYINFEKKEVKVSNLYDIYSENISARDYINFINDQEKNKQTVYDGTAPITNFIVNNILTNLEFKLKDKTGSAEKYLELVLSLLNQQKNRLDYKQYSFINNIMINTILGQNRKGEIKPYEEISSIKSTSCDNSLFTPREGKELIGSDVLTMAFFLDNFKFIDLNEYWADNLKLLPVYLIEKLTNFNIFYLDNINESSLYETWLPLTKEFLQKVDAKKYLCTIGTDKMYIQNSLIENYFILEK